MAENDDPHGFITMLCQPTRSQQRILRRCSFASEYNTDGSESSVTSFSDGSESSVNETSNTVAIVISSPPETDNDLSPDTDESDTREENDRFVTPPENHIRSSSSCSSRQGKSSTLENDAILLETMFDPEDWRAENVATSSDLGKGNPNLGFSNSEKAANIHAENDNVAVKIGEAVDNPSSKEGVSSDGQNSSRYFKVEKASWPEIVNHLKVLFGYEDDDEDEGSEHKSLLEALEKRGLTFPKP